MTIISPVPTLGELIVKLQMIEQMHGSDSTWSGWDDGSLNVFGARNDPEATNEDDGNYNLEPEKR